MPKFGPESLRQRATLDPRLQRVLDEAILYFDFAIVEGHRGKVAQDAAVKAKLSQTPWPRSQHNKVPSRAADCAPYPIDWGTKATAVARFAFMQGVILACARRQNVKVRFGFDWNRNFDPRDETFLDWPHIEVDEP